MGRGPCSAAAFPLAVLAAVRGAAGPDFPVIFRMSGADLTADEGAPEEYSALAAALADAGADALNIGIGWHESQIPTVQSLVPHGSWLSVAAGIRADLRSRGHRLPVIGSNRINSVAQADAALAAGQRGLCVHGTARSWPTRGSWPRPKPGRVDLVNTCIACNEACIDRSLGTEPVSCLVNPTGGPGARVPARPRGRSLRRRNCSGCRQAPVRPVCRQPPPSRRPEFRSIFSKSEAEIGGQFRLARCVPGKADFAETIRYFSNELPRLGVQDPYRGAGIAAQGSAGFRHVVDATGVLPRTVQLAGAGIPVLDYRQAFADPAALPARIAVVGGGGIAVDLGASAAAGKDNQGRRGLSPGWTLPRGSRREHLPPGPPRADGRQITLLRRGARIGDGIGISTRWAALQALRNAGVVLRTGVAYRKLVPGGLLIDGPDGSPN